MKLCVICSSEILNEKNIKYCSVQCRKVGARINNKERSVCKICGNIIERKNKKYCSTKCRVESTRLYITATCIRCGKEFTVAAKRVGEAKFCSMNCYSGYYTDKYKQRMCPQCGIEFRVPDYDDRVFCCMKCLNTYDREHSKNNKLCPYCGKGFYKYSKYCCRGCSLKAGNRKSKGKSLGFTNIEKLLYDTFLESGLIENKDFIIEHSFGRMSFDFYFPNEMVAIEADGKYWHSLPDRKSNDAKKYKRATESNIVLLRFGEDDILSSVKNIYYKAIIPVLRDRFQGREHTII